MNGLHRMPERRDSSDEDLMRQVAAGKQEALEPLYSRYAPLIFNLAARSLDRAAAEEIVQDVFLAVWREATTFSSERGTFRSWALQIARFRVLNELRRRSRRPQLEIDPDGAQLAEIPDADPEPAEATWREYRRAALRSAFEALPEAQRQALGLAFFEDLSHEQVATVLHLPLGTAKTRIRAGLQKLRAIPHIAALALSVMLVVIGVRYLSERTIEQRDDRALSLLTMSDTADLRLAPLPGMPDNAHARYRGRPGAPIAVLTLSSFPPAPAGKTYQAWALHHGTWASLGSAQPDAGGAARWITEGTELTALPDALQITVEPSAGSPVPSGPVVAHWPR